MERQEHPVYEPVVEPGSMPALSEIAVMVRRRAAFSRPWNCGQSGVKFSRVKFSLAALNRPPISGESRGRGEIGRRNGLKRKLSALRETEK